jgi:AraC-like DNA-binding protein
VCVGTFLLAEAGLLNGRRVVTHWMHCGLLSSSYPDITVEPDAIYIRDGAIWSSAGVTTGIDLALALIEQDCGRTVAMHVARVLVVYLRRMGGQSQYSALLAAQVESASDAFAELECWIAENLAEDLSVERLAERAAMSPRNFAPALHRSAQTHSCSRGGEHPGRRGSARPRRDRGPNRCDRAALRIQQRRAAARCVREARRYSPASVPGPLQSGVTSPIRDLAGGARVCSSECHRILVMKRRTQMSSDGRCPDPPTYCLRLTPRVDSRLEDDRDRPKARYRAHHLSANQHRMSLRVVALIVRGRGCHQRPAQVTSVGICEGSRQTRSETPG